MTSFKIIVQGDLACFTRPEMKVERVSYDVITPSAARGILEAIHWKPAIRWVVDRIHVLKPARFVSIRRNEIGCTIPTKTARAAMSKKDPGLLGIAIEENRQQRAMLAVRDVRFGIEAHFEMTDRAGESDNTAKHADIFRRRAIRGQCFHQPCLGVREFPADFSLVEASPETELPDNAKTKNMTGCSRTPGGCSAGRCCSRTRARRHAGTAPFGAVARSAPDSGSQATSAASRASFA